MLSVHDRTATDFTATGLGVLDPEVVEARVVEELGGQYTLTLSYPADGPLAKHLVLEALIASPVPGVGARQGFRIHEASTTLDGLLQITAFHVFYDLAGNFIADTYVVNQTAKAALDQLLKAAATPHRFTATSSDTATRASARVVRMPLAAALMDTGEDNTFASRWAGEITRDNWHIHHAARRGADRGVVIRDRKNLTGYESVVDLTSVVTRIVPVGYDGITLPELYVDSPKLSAYVTPRIRVIRYPDIKAIKDAERPREDEVPLDQAHALLRQAARAEFSRNHVDEPAGSYSVSFVELASTEEYADFAELETVLLGDTVTVRHADLGVALAARVVAYDYDPLAEAYVSVELGSVAARFTSITRTVESAVTAAEAASDLAGVALASADGKTTNHYGPTQPATARLGDTWFKDNGETAEIWIYQVTDTGQPGWVALATDLNHAQVAAELAAARAEVEAAHVAAEAAQAAANAVAVRMSAAESEIGLARQAAADAATTAGQVEQATTAITQRLTDAEGELTQTASAVSDLDTRLMETTTVAQAAASELASVDARLEGIDQQVTAVAADAQAAHNAAVDAATHASQASIEAARVAGIVDGKADVLIQNTVPATGLQKASTLWIDTTAGANTPKRWNGTTWVAVTDKTALDAAARAATATNAASVAQQRADAAYSLADSKPSDTRVQELADAAEQAAIAAAAADAQAKADQATAAALAGAATDAQTRADAAKAQAIAAASQDAAAKAAQALADAKAALQLALAQARSEITTEIENSANGKNTITLSTGSPTGVGSRVGDTWWRRADSVIIGQWSWDGSRWLATRLRHEVIASVDVNTLLVSGSARMNQAVVAKIIGDAAYFGTLAAHRVVVGDGTNLWSDQDLTYRYAGWDNSPPGRLSRVATGQYNAQYYPHTDILVKPGEQYRVTFEFSRSDPSQGVGIAYRRHFTATDSWPNSGTIAHAKPGDTTVTSMLITVADGVDVLRFGLVTDAHTTPGARVELWNIQIRRLTSATMIEDSAITTDKIAANTITTTHLQAGAVTSDKLTIANGFITNAMIANAAIADAKIASLSASKITTGYLAAARIQAGSITSDKLVIANGFITNAMIANAAITDAKISSLSASKITTGTLSANRIAARSITSDKLTIASGFITNAMIADAAITNAKIAGLDAGKITTGVLNAARIGARTITADKLATNAIQVGLAGWTSSIRISPTQIAWYSGSSLEGKIISAGMQFWYGTRYIGEMARRQKKDAADVQGIVNQLAYRGDYVAWTYQTTSTGDYYTCLTLDPKGRFYGRAGIHLGADLRMNGYKVYTSDTRYISFVDTNYTGKGTFASISSSNGLAKIGFHTYDLLVTTNGSYYNMSRVFDRLKDLMARVNELIRRLNYGWIVSISGSGSNITWSNYDNTGLSTMSTTIS